MTTGSIAEHFGTLAGLRDAGLIRHLGISNVTSAHLAQAKSIAPVVCVQNPFGIAAPAAERELLLACGEQGVAYVPFFTIAGQGRVSGADPDDDEGEVLAIAKAHGVSAAQVRLAWTLQLGPHVLAIPGTGNPEHLEDNVAAGALRLSADEMRRLTSL
jgi:pyridoxine 4-dehydrogenase